MPTSVVVVAHRVHEWLEQCLRSVVDSADEVVVVDNGSAGHSVSAASRPFGATVVRSPVNLGFPGGVNAGVAASRGDRIALLNDDAMAEPGWLERSAEALRPGVAAVAPKLLFHLPFAELRFDDAPRRIGEDHRALGRQLRRVTAAGVDVLDRLFGPGVHPVETAGGEKWRWTTGPEPIYLRLEPGWTAGDVVVDGAPAPSVREVTLLNGAGSYLSHHGYGGDYGFGGLDDGEFDEPADRFGASFGAVVFDRRVWDDIGPLAAEFFAYYEDLDWSWRAQLLGYSIRYEPSAVVRHVGGATTGGPLAGQVKRLAGRNRLLCLVRNAPGPVVRDELARAREEGVLTGDVAWRLVRAAGQRRGLRRRWRRPPDEVWREWAGRNERWSASAPA